MRIARVFPRRTKASPDDDLAFFGPPGLFPPDVDRVEVSVAFTWDLGVAQRLADEWLPVAPVDMGGPALGQPSGEFEPGRYLKRGYVITSRGCPNRCWFCSAWKREGGIRELEIKEGSNVLDDNLLACSEGHVRRVFDMLSRQPAVQFSGGLEAARLRAWHVELLAKIKPKQMFFAYDTPDDLEPLREASKMLREAGLIDPSKRVRAYVLCGYPKDTIAAAEARMKETLALGIFPMAMLFRDRIGKKAQAWSKFQKFWARPAYMSHAASGVDSVDIGRWRNKMNFNKFWMVIRDNGTSSCTKRWYSIGEAREEAMRLCRKEKVPFIVLEAMERISLEEKEAPINIEKMYPAPRLGGLG